MIEQIRTAMQLASGVMEIPRKRAEKLAKQLVKGVDIPTGQVSRLVDDIVSRSRENAQILQSLVTSEVRRQVKSLGLATREDVDRLSRRVFSLATKEEFERLNERVRDLDARVSKENATPRASSAKTPSLRPSTPGSAPSGPRARKSGASRAPASPRVVTSTPVPAPRRPARSSKPGRVSPKGSSS